MRAVVRNEEKARKLFPNGVEIDKADMLNEEAVTGVAAWPRLYSLEIIFLTVNGKIISWNSYQISLKDVGKPSQL